jgi:imidazolonepropionase-like amidohydrolase
MASSRRPLRVLATCLLCGLLPVASTRAAPPPDKVAVKGGTIFTVTGPKIPDGTVLIERGKIVAVGTDVEIPYDARVIDASGKVVFPGMVNVHTWRGLDRPNEVRPVVPQLDVRDAIDPSSLVFEDFLRLGTTAVHVIPADNTAIGGVGRVVRPIGMTVGDMTIAKEDFLKLSVSPRRGADRMVQMATLREAFLQLDDALARLAEKQYEEKLKEDEEEIEVGPEEARKRGVKLIEADDLGDEHRNLVRLRGGHVAVGKEKGEQLLEPLGAFVYCERAMDVAHAVELAQQEGFFGRLVLVLGTECFKAIDELKKAARPVVLPPTLIHREVNPLTGEIHETFVAKPIFDAGLHFALVPGPDRSYPERMLTYQAAQCVRYGIPRDVALRAITINPAKFLTLGDRLGSIEPGKDAHLVILSGDPLDFSSVVEKVLIDGILAYEREKDIRLQRLLAPGLNEVKENQE